MLLDKNKLEALGELTLNEIRNHFQPKVNISLADHVFKLLDSEILRDLNPEEKASVAALMTMYCLVDTELKKKVDDIQKELDVAAQKPAN